MEHEHTDAQIHTHTWFMHLYSFVSLATDRGTHTYGQGCGSTFFQSVRRAPAMSLVRCLGVRVNPFFRWWLDACQWQCTKQSEQRYRYQLSPGRKEMNKSGYLPTGSCAKSRLEPLRLALHEKYWALFFALYEIYWALFLALCENVELFSLLFAEDS